MYAYVHINMHMYIRASIYTVDTWKLRYTDPCTRKFTWTS